ncbi:MAG: ferric reductase-like transmembrane domain-containing protein [Terriglobales bacterium]
MSAIDLAGDLGLVAICLLSLNILIGLLISVRYNPRRGWPRRRLDLFRYHNWTGYTGLTFTIAHPLPLAWASRSRFSWAQIAWPIHAPSQPLVNTLGAIALYLVVLVAVTSYYRVALGRQAWKWVHYLSYVAAALFFLHGVVADAALRGAPLDPLDAEKVVIEACFLLVAASSFARWRYARLHPRARRVAAAVPLPYIPGFADEEPAAGE